MICGLPKNRKKPNTCFFVNGVYVFEESCGGMIDGRAKDIVEDAPCGIFYT